MVADSAKEITIQAIHVLALPTMYKVIVQSTAKELIKTIVC
jgi:hypothetical protein